MRFVGRAIFALVLMGCLGQRAHTALAQAAAAPVFSLPQLMAQFSAIKTSSAHYSERKYMRMLKAPLQASGVLIYAAPSRLQKDTLQPKPERLLVDGDTLTIEREGKTQTLSRSDYPQIWVFIEGIRATLAGDLSALERYYLVRLDGTNGDWQLLLQPRDEKMQEIARSIRVFGSDAHIKHIVTEEKDGDRTDMTIVEDAR